MRYTLSQHQFESLATIFKAQVIRSAPEDGVTGELMVEIYGDDDMIGATPQFKWNGLYIHRDGSIWDEPEGDGWVSVEGDIIGWLAPDDPAGVEVDCCVVLAADGTIWLRWIGNDIFGTRNGEEFDDEFKIGDHVSFSTNKEEQERYANHYTGVDPAVEGKTVARPEVGDDVVFLDSDGTERHGTLHGISDSAIMAVVIWHFPHEYVDRWVPYSHLEVEKKEGHDPTR